MIFLLLVLLATGATATLSVSQESAIVETGKLLYKGVQLRSYKIDDLELLEPYTALQLTEGARIVKAPIGKGYYFSVPLTIESSIEASRDGKKLEVMQATSATVSLRKNLTGQCAKDCSELTVACVRKQGDYAVTFNCQSLNTCQRIFNALHSNSTNDDADFVRSALQFTFSGVIGGRNLRLTKSWIPLVQTNQRPFSSDLWFEGDKLLLFTIKAGSGENAYQSFMSDSIFAIPTDGSLPDVFRSELLDALPAVLASRVGQLEMVAEMRVGDDRVAQVVFDVSKDQEKVDKTSWFSPSRVKSSYPFWIGRSDFNFFGVAGHQELNRHFFINRKYGGCPVDEGLWVVSDQRDPCPWASNGFKERIPTLLYNKYPGKYQDRGAAYADRFLVYLRYASANVGKSGNLLPALPNSFVFEESKVLLFTIKAGIGRDAMATFLNKQDFPIPADHSLPDVYRSDLIDSLADGVMRSGRQYMVAEMRVANKPVAQVFFDVSINRQTLNKESWFSAARVVSSSPYVIGNSGFNIFSINGDNTWRRNFFISNRYLGCEADSNFWVVSSARDPCTWGNKHWTSAPALVYNPVPNTATVNSGARADQFLIYLV